MGSQPLSFLAATTWADAGMMLFGMVVLVAVPMVMMNWFLSRREAGWRARGFTPTAPPGRRRVMPLDPCYRVVGRVRPDGRETTFYVAALSASQARDRAERKGVAVSFVAEEW